MEIRGLLPVIPTPILDHRFDALSLERLLDHFLDELDGYTLLGSTGEAPSLTTQERMEIAAVALSMTPSDKTAVIGVSHTCAADTIALARHAQDNGAKAVLCSAPYYFQNSASGVLAYLHELDEVLDIDLVLYDNPQSTKTVLDAATVVRWAQELEHLGTVKLTDHNLDKIAIWHDAGLRVLAGDDPIVFRYLAAGVDGAMVIAPAIFPTAFRAAWDLLRQGDLTRAFDVLAHQVFPFSHVFGIGDEVATTKALLADIGVFTSDEVRPPLQSVDSKRRALLRMAYDNSRSFALGSPSVS